MLARSFDTVLPLSVSSREIVVGRAIVSMDLNKLTMGQVLGSLPLMRDRLYLGEDGRGHGSRHGPQHDTLVEL